MLWQILVRNSFGCAKYVVDAPSLEGFTTGLDEALGNLIQRVVSLPWQGVALGGGKVPSDPSCSVALRWVEELHAVLVGAKAGQSMASSCQSHCVQSRTDVVFRVLQIVGTV